MKIKTLENKIFECDSGMSILDSALNKKLTFEYSCKNGQCGVCKTTLLEGEVEQLRPQLSLTEEQIAKNQILTCCCAAKTDILINAIDLSALHDIQTKTLPARITTIKRHTTDIIEVDLRLPPNSNFKFLPGQYLDVMANNIRRSYSIASISGQAEIKLLIKRFANGEMSEYWFNTAQDNDLLRIEGPKGTFFLRDVNKKLLFLATGTGIAPIISILKSLDEKLGFEQKQEMNVYWGNRYPEDFVNKFEFKNLKVNFVRVCSKPDSDWNEKVGYVQDAAIKYLDVMNSAVYACGSNAMIQSSKQLFIESGLPENQFYSDAFVQSY